MTSLLQMGFATREDDADIRGLIRDNPMGGGIRLLFLKEPNYFDALEVEGEKNDVIIGRNGGGRVAVVANRSFKRMYVNGSPVAVGYLSGLRLSSAHRGGTALRRGYAFFRDIHDDNLGPFYLSTIVSDNIAAKKVLLGRRRGMPAYEDYGLFHTVAISLNRNRRHNLRVGTGASIRNASTEDLPLIADFLSAEGRKKQFFPVYTEQDIVSPVGILRGLGTEDILLAFKGKELLGMMAAWDQTAFKQVLIEGYGFPLRQLRPVYNVAAYLLGYPVLPRPCTKLRFCYLSLICIKDNNEQVFDDLLSALITAESKRHRLMLCGMHDRDPLLEVLKRYRHFSFRSNLYIVHWQKSMLDKIGTDLIPYLELGAL